MNVVKIAYRLLFVSGVVLSAWTGVSAKEIEVKGKVIDSASTFGVKGASVLFTQKGRPGYDEEIRGPLPRTPAVFGTARSGDDGSFSVRITIPDTVKSVGVTIAKKDYFLKNDSVQTSGNIDMGDKQVVMAPAYSYADVEAKGVVNNRDGGSALGDVTIVVTAARRGGPPEITVAGMIPRRTKCLDNVVTSSDGKFSSFVNVPDTLKALSLSCYKADFRNASASDTIRGNVADAGVVQMSKNGTSGIIFTAKSMQPQLALCKMAIYSLQGRLLYSGRIDEITPTMHFLNINQPHVIQYTTMRGDLMTIRSVAIRK